MFILRKRIPISGTAVSGIFCLCICLFKKESLGYLKIFWVSITTKECENTLSFSASWRNKETETIYKFFSKLLER